MAKLKTSVTLDRGASRHSHFVSDADWGQPAVPEALLSVPLRNTEGEVVGVLSAGKSTTGAFSIEDRVVLEAAGKIAVTALRQAQLTESDHLEYHAAHALLAALATLGKDTMPETVLRVLGQHARALLNCGRVRVYIYNEKQ